MRAPNPSDEEEFNRGQGFIFIFIYFWLETTSFMDIIVIMTCPLHGSILHAIEPARWKMR
jgi:hypothetical protein